MGAAPPTFIAAAVQAAPVFLDRDACIDKAVHLIGEAAAAGAALVAFPETWIPGYPNFVWLGAPAWAMQFIQRYHANSLAVGDAGFERLCAAAAEHRIHVVLGYSERDGGSLYLAQALIDDRGRLLCNRRKLKPTHVERTVFGEGDGSDLRVETTALGRLGALCCWEHLQPLTRYAMYSMNEQVHVAAWPQFSLYEGMANALGPEVNTAASMMYAVEGQCFVIAPCATVAADQVEALCDTEERRAMLGPGGGYARIYAPDGRSIGNTLAPGEEGLVLAEIDPGLIALAKAAADPCGHYARPDVTRLLLDRTRRRPVEDATAAAGPVDADGQVP